MLGVCSVVGLCLVVKVSDWLLALLCRALRVCVFVCAVYVFVGCFCLLCFFLVGFGYNGLVRYLCCVSFSIVVFFGCLVCCVLLAFLFACMLFEFLVGLGSLWVLYFVFGGV